MDPSPYEIALSTDLYELTMASSYHALGWHGRAVFSLYVRKLPEQRHFLVVAGVNELLERILDFCFDDQARASLRTLPVLRPEFVDSLASFRFQGDVWAVREGTVIFPEEPILEVEAPIDQAQIIETLVLNAIHYPTLVATKAARCVLAAPGKTLVDFGLRRTPSLDAGLAAARAAYLVGFAATSNVLAGARYGIPVSGTVAHSYIESFPSELEAFRAFARTYPGDPILLIDTYDTLRGAEHAVIVARELAQEGRRVRAVRLDSGDLASLSRAVRQILDQAGFPDIQIFASGGLDEYELAALEVAGAPIDGYGVGSRLGTSADAPLADMAYKLVEYEGQPVLKLSTGKRTLVGAKQVWRRVGPDGRYSEDMIALRDEPPPGPDWIPLLRPVMRGGTIVELPSLAELREHHREEMARLPDWLRSLSPNGGYPVRLSERLQRRQREAEHLVRQREGALAMLHRVRLAPVQLDAYREVAPESQVEELAELGRQLQGLRVAHINATPYGGGVSELLRSSVALECGLGVAVDWLVISGDSRFFEVTKALHNGLQGASFVSTADVEEIYLLNNRANAATIPSDYDVIVVHDPQPAAIRAFAPRQGARWVWRCHIDTSEPDPAAEAFLLPWLEGYDALVFTLADFVLPALRGRTVEIFPPGIDPLSPKNLPLPASLCRRIVNWYGVDNQRPLMVQVSRFDPWKDPLGVIRVFRRAREQVPGLQLALIGAMALDDPEGWRIYEQVRSQAEQDSDILVGTNLTGISFVEVNAFQHCAWVVVQKSRREGFGLVVSEALWKETPVVAGRSGGITLQMADGEGGYLVDPDDEETFTERVIELMQDRELARRIGQRGRQRVRERFLVTRYVADELRLFARLISTGQGIDTGGNGIVSMTSDGEWLETQRKRLEQRREELVRQYQQGLRFLAAEGQSQADEGTVASHPADAASDVTMAEYQQTVLRTLEEELHEVLLALDRIAEGRYGICVDCGRPIERERLEAVPWAARCIADQERFEKELERQHRSS